MGTKPQVKLRCAQNAMREALSPLPSLARALPHDEVTVMRFLPTARETQARMAEVTPGKAAPSLPCVSFWKHTQQDITRRVGSSHSSSCFSKCPHHWFKTKISAGETMTSNPRTLLDSSFTILFIFSNQWKKLTSWTWKLSQFYRIVPSFCCATLTLHFPELKCFISSCRQLFI